MNYGEDNITYTGLRLEDLFLNEGNFADSDDEQQKGTTDGPVQEIGLTVNTTRSLMMEGDITGGSTSTSTPNAIIDAQHIPTLPQQQQHETVAQAIIQNDHYIKGIYDLLSQMAMQGNTNLPSAVATNSESKLNLVSFMAELAISAAGNDDTGLQVIKDKWATVVPPAPTPTKHTDLSTQTDNCVTQTSASNASPTPSSQLATVASTTPSSSQINTCAHPTSAAASITVDLAEKLNKALANIHLAPTPLNNDSNLKDWVECTEVYIKEKSIKGESLQNLMKLSLKDKYKTWWRATANNLTTWQEIKHNLFADFVRRRDDQDRLATIASMRHQKGTTPLSFYNEMVFHYGKLRAKVDESVQVDRIVRFLQPDCRSVIAAKGARNLKDLRKAIQDLPTWLKFNEEPDGPPTKDLQASAATQQRARGSEETSKTLSLFEDRLKRLEAENSKLRAEAAAFVPKQAAAPRDNNRQPTQRAPQEQRDTRHRGTPRWHAAKRCYDCGEVGHIRVNCTNPEKKAEFRKALMIRRSLPLLATYVTVGKTSFIADFDTGAETNHMTKSLLYSLVTNPIIEPYDGSGLPQFMNGTVGDTPLGYCLLTITLHGRRIRSWFEIAENMVTDCILGMPYMAAGGIAVDPGNREAYFKSRPHFVFKLNARDDERVTMPRTNAVWRTVVGEKTRDVSVLTQDQFGELETFLSHQSDIFPGRAGKTSVLQHKIEFRQDPVPYVARCYKQSPHIQKEMAKMVDKLLAEDKIEPSTSEWGAAFFLKKKSDNTYRGVLDYRELNKQIKNDAYPMPHIDEVMSFLAGKKYISILDGESGFHQIPLHPDSRDVTTFNCSRGAYRWKVLPFGLKNSSAEFQRVMCVILRPYIGNICMIYIDDVIIATETWEEHLKALSLVFQAFRKAGFTLKRTKCNFCLPTMTILGLTVSTDGVHLKGQHTTALSHFPRPRTRHQLQQYLGLTNYFRKFVKNYALVAKPLTSLLKTDQQFRWDAQCQEAFQNLKDRILQSECLQLPNFEHQFCVETDASDLGIGAVLTQHIEGKTNVVEFYSRTLQPTEQKYSAYDKEALAVVAAVERWRHYLEGARFKLITDCNAVKWALSSKHLNARNARWALRLQVYDFDIIHRAGALNVVADALSRNPVPVKALMIRTLPRDPIEDKETLRAQQKDDPHGQKIWLALTNTEKAKQRCSAKFVENAAKSYCIKDNLIYYVDLSVNPKFTERTQFKIYVPAALRHYFLSNCHDHQLAGHLGIAKTLARIRRIAFWPGVFRDVKAYVRSCHSCQITKPAQGPKKGKLVSVLPNYPFEMVGLDFVGPLITTAQGNRYILTIIDYFTKWVWLVATRYATARTAAVKLLQTVINDHGPPKFLVTDNGPAFAANLFKCVTKKIKAVHRFTTVYHPQSNATERTNRTMKTCLRTYVHRHHGAWGPLLPSIQYAMRTAPHASTGETPYFMLYARDPHSHLADICMPEREATSGIAAYIEEHTALLQETHDLARATLAESARLAKLHYDKHRRDDNFKINQLVKVRNHPQSSADRGITRKLAPVYIAPFRVIRQQGEITYRVRSLKDPTDERTVNVVDMETYFHPLTMDEFGLTDASQKNNCTSQSHSEHDENDGEGPATVHSSEDDQNHTTDQQVKSAADDTAEEDECAYDCDIEEDDQPAPVQRRPVRTKRLPRRYDGYCLRTLHRWSSLPFQEIANVNWQSVVN